MDQQTPDQGWQELQAHMEGFFDQILRVEKEKALLSASRMEAKIEQSGIPGTDRQEPEKKQKIEWQIGRLPLEQNSPLAWLLAVAIKETGKDPKLTA